MRNLVFRIVIAVLAVAGLTVSVLALKVHNMDPSAAPPCAVSEKWDCGAVNHSRFAVFPPRSFDEDASSKKLHLPVATLGIVGYALMLLAALAGRFRVTLQLAQIGFAAACMLTYLEAFVLEKWCIYCVWSQGIVASILVVSIVAVIVRRRSGRVLQMP